MANFTTNILAFILVLGFLIFAHEAGHFAFAKLFRVRVLVFSFGFGKRLFGFRRGPTDYRVSLIPLGGYVRMAGDTPEENEKGAEDEFLSKPKWQRFLILFAGPMMNILIAIGIVAAVAMIGTEEIVTKPVIGQVVPNKPAARAGLEPGDRIVAIAGEPMEDFDDVRLAISMNADTPLKVVYLRDGIMHTTTLTPERENSDYGPVGRAGINYGIEPIVGRLEKDSPAEKAGVLAGDRIVSAAGKPVHEMGDFAKLSTDTKGAIPIEVMRGTQKVSLTLAPMRDADDVGRGVIPQTVVTKLAFVPALRHSVRENWKMLRYAGAAVARMFRPEGSVKELSGPISIARISGDMLRRGWLPTIMLMAMISLQLGVMNLLPIPVLDGGHIAILLVEGVARRDLSIRAKERIQQLGFAALAALMIVVLYNDVISNVLRLRQG